MTRLSRDPLARARARSQPEQWGDDEAMTLAEAAKLLFPHGPQVIAPRGLSRVEAAGYVGISPSLFDELVKDGRMPVPKHINSRTVWDRFGLDQAFDALPDKGDRNPWNEAAE